MKNEFIYIALLIISGIFLSSLGSCVDESRALNAMKSSGWTDLRLVDRTNFLAPFAGCGGEDAAAFQYSGKNPAGTISTTTVCCGIWLKGCTIRF